jgi:uncharacterized protein
MSSESYPAPSICVRRADAPGLPARAALAVLSLYRLAISPLLGPHCRFTPSCSVYAAEAIRRYGLLAGVWKGARRIARCHPFHPGGYDPVK